MTTDSWQQYGNLAIAGYNHPRIAPGGDQDKLEEVLAMIHLVFSDLKTWLLDTHHSVRAQRLLILMSR